MPKSKSWKVSDSFWNAVEPLIPQPQRDPNKKYQRKSGGGRKPILSRRIFEGIMFVLRTGCQWQALPKERFGSPSAIYTHFARWQRQGFFLALWQKGLAEYDDMEGIALNWRNIDGAMTQAPLAQETVGRAWSPALDRRHRSKSAQCHTTESSA